ncbi:MAG: hypothetical protein RJA70_1606 [Pseudomonadota bacterium]|jgi:prepilin-type N-terminal cleavage/methylation domain-containing protein
MGRPNPQQGYTVVELMMAMAVMTIGIMGVFSMQKVTLEANQHAKNLSIANHIAQAWLDELAAESSQWNDTDDFDETVWLGLVGAENTVNPNWIRPTYNAARMFGPAFDALGSPVATLNIANDAHFCSDIRLTWMHGQNTVKRGGGLIRAQVRVYWRVQGALDLAGSPPAHVCAKTALEMDQDDALQLFHFVYATTAVRQHLGAD